MNATTKCLLSISMGLLVATGVQAAEKTNRWSGDIGFVKAPHGDGVTLELVTPRLYTRNHEAVGRETNLRLALVLDDIWTTNLVQNDSGNFESQSYQLLSGTLKWTNSLSGGGQTFADLGYGHFFSTNEFRGNDLSALIVGVGFGAPLGTVRYGERECSVLGVVSFRHVFADGTATKLAGQPDVFSGGYFSASARTSY